MQALKKIFWLMFAVGTATGATATCNITIGFETYREEVLASKIKQPDGLAVDFSTGTLYFSHFDGAYSSAELNLSTKEVYEIEELNDRCLFTVDQSHEKVHAGCGHYRQGVGLFQFDSNIGRFIQTGEEKQLINFVHYNQALYYSAQPSSLLHIFRRGKSIPVDDLTSEVYDLVIDKNQDRIFYNSTGLYRQRAEDFVVARFENMEKPQALAVDRRGSAYACTWGNRAGIYRLHDLTTRATRLIEIEWCKSLTFDNHNNLIYPDDTRIMRLIQC